MFTLIQIYFCLSEVFLIFFTEVWHISHLVLLRSIVWILCLEHKWHLLFHMNFLTGDDCSYEVIRRILHFASLLNFLFLFMDLPDGIKSIEG